MRLLDDKGRVFGKISIVDLGVILVLAVAALWFGYAKWGRNLGAETAIKEQEMEIVIVISGIRPGTAQAFADSTNIFEFKTGVPLGVVADVEVEPAVVYYMDETGRYIRDVTRDRVNAYVKVKGSGRVGADSITMNGIEVRVGLSLGVHTKYAQASGFIVSMNLGPGEGK